jgi:hypothetical protein
MPCDAPLLSDDVNKFFTNFLISNFETTFAGISGSAWSAQLKCQYQVLTAPQ